MRRTKPPKWRPRGFLSARARPICELEGVEWYRAQKAACMAAQEAGQLAEWLEDEWLTMWREIAKDWGDGATSGGRIR